MAASMTPVDKAWYTSDPGMELVAAPMAVRPVSKAGFSPRILTPPKSAGATSGLPFEVKTPAQQLADKAHVASISPAPGAVWFINLGDYATKNDAQAILQQLRQRTPELVAGKTAQTVMVEKAGTVTYRARFTGFDNKEEARTACDKLVRQRYDCVLMPARG